MVGVLAALKRSERAFEKDDVIFLEQVGRQVAWTTKGRLRSAIKKRNRGFTGARLAQNQHARIVEATTDARCNAAFESVLSSTIF